MQKRNRFALLPDEAEEPHPNLQSESLEADNTRKAEEELPIISLSHLFMTSIRYFWELVDKVNDDSFGHAIPAVLIARTSNEYSRLKIWGQQTRISSDPRTRASLEESLRDERGIRNVVAGALGQLTEEIQSGMSLETSEKNAQLLTQNSDSSVG